MGLQPDPAPASRFEPGPQSVPADTARGWPLAQRLAFRLVFVYLILYILPFPINTLDSLVTALGEIVTGEAPAPDQPSLISQYVTRPYAEFWDQAVLWTGSEVFGVEIEYRPAGSGDTTWNYVQVFDFAILAVALTLLWTLASWCWSRLRRRSQRGYPLLFAWLWVYVRFYLAQMMIVYGSFKVIKLQFSYPGPDTLLHTYGESSPMHLLWTFMGASDGYTWFAGAGEMLGGLLLCTRRTALLGALVSFAVMLNVAALNFCYDVPVKLFSAHLVLMSLFVMAPDLPWLARVFVLGRADRARGYTPLVRRRWLDRTLAGVRTLIVLTFVGVTLYQSYQTSMTYGQASPEPPLYGLWEVEEFALDGKTRPPLTTDAVRWQRVTFNKGSTFRRMKPVKPSLSVINMPGKNVLFAQCEVDEEKKTITLIQGGTAPPRVLRYRELESEVIEVTGELVFVADGKRGPRQMKVRLRHYGPDKFLLSSRGFHWINEMPYNRHGPRTEPPPRLPPPPKRP
jgi:uncharacterized membrane protein YphA (DoxX/SURF4 family)